MGAAVGGITLGLVESLAIIGISSSYKDVVAFSVLIVIMILITITIAAFGLITQIDVMTAGGPLDATTTVIYQAVVRGFRQQDIAYGSAISVLTLFALALLILLVLYGGRRFRKED